MSISWESVTKDVNKAKYWGLASSRYSSLYLDIYAEADLRTPTQWNNWEDINTRDWTFNVTWMHDSCVVSGRWLYFSSWDGSA